MLRIDVNVGPFGVGCKKRWLMGAVALVALASVPKQAFSLELKISETLSSQEEGSKGVIARVQQTLKLGFSGLSRVGEVLIGESKHSEVPVRPIGYTSADVQGRNDGSQPALPLPVSLVGDGAALSISVGEGSQVVVGNLINPKRPIHGSEQTGMHWVNRVNENTSFYLGVRRNSGDAKETTSGFGWIYDLD